MENENKNVLKNSSPAITVVFVIIVVLLLGVNLTIMFQINEIKSTKEELSSELDNILNENERLEYEIGMFADYVVVKEMLENTDIDDVELRRKLNESLDEETIRKIAKEKLGLVDPNEEHYIVS